MMKYTLQILPNYQAPKDVLHFIWHEMESVEEPVFNFLSMAIWGLASVFNFLISAIVVVLFFTIFTAFKLVEFGINLALLLCKGLWHGIKNIFESLSELYHSTSVAFLSPNKLPAYKGGPRLWNIPFAAPTRKKPEQDIDLTKVNSTVHGKRMSLYMLEYNLTTSCSDAIMQLESVGNRSLHEQQTAIKSHSTDWIKLYVPEFIKGLDTNYTDANLTKALWKRANTILSKIDSDCRDYKILNCIFKKYYIVNYSGLVEARINNSVESYDRQLITCFNDQWKGFTEIYMALRAYMTISCFYTAYLHAQNQKLLTDNGIFDWNDSILDGSDSGSEAGSAPRYGR